MNKEELLPPNEKGILFDDFRIGDKQWLCLWNNSANQTLYISLRYDDGGIRNFGIEPRGMQRTYVGQGQGNICWQYGTPITSNCPNAIRITQWSGNCP